MQKIKIMLASRPEMISDVIRNIVESQLDMVLIGEVVDPIRLIYATRDTEVDAIIVTPMNTNGIPRICSHLLAEHPNLKIIVLLAEGKTAFLYESGFSKKYINEPSADTIVNTIRQSLEKIRNKQPQVN
jgi:DNA-binding NarL/FixJ family response regulator